MAADDVRYRMLRILIAIIADNCPRVVCLAQRRDPEVIGVVNRFELAFPPMQNRANYLPGPNRYRSPPQRR